MSKLRAKGITVIPTDLVKEDDNSTCDLSVMADVRELIQHTSPDRIVHCAAHVPKAMDEYSDDRIAVSNLKMLDNILKESACPIIFISSMTVYGKEKDHAVREEDSGEASSAYGRGKCEGEGQIRADGRVGLSVRIPGLFGLPRRQGVVYNIISAAKSSIKLQLPSEALLWAAMHVDDAAESIAVLSTAKIDQYEAVNVGYRGKQSINLLVSLVSEAYGWDYDYNVTHPRFEFDLTRAHRYGAVPVISFREALINFGKEI